MSRVTTEIEGHVAHVTLTRPDKMNAVDPEMAEATVAAGHALVENLDIGPHAGEDLVRAGCVQLVS